MKLNRPLDPEETSAVVTNHARISVRIGPPPGVPLSTLLGINPPTRTVPSP